MVTRRWTRCAASRVSWTTRSIVLHTDHVWTPPAGTDNAKNGDPRATPPRITLPAGTSALRGCEDGYTEVDAVCGDDGTLIAVAKCDLKPCSIAKGPQRANGHLRKRARQRVEAHTQAELGFTLSGETSCSLGDLVSRRVTRRRATRQRRQHSQSWKLHERTRGWRIVPARMRTKATAFPASPRAKPGNSSRRLA